MMFPPAEERLREVQARKQSGVVHIDDDQLGKGVVWTPAHQSLKETARRLLHDLMATPLQIETYDAEENPVSPHQKDVTQGYTSPLRPWQNLSVRSSLEETSRKTAEREPSSPEKFLNF